MGFVRFSLQAAIISSDSIKQLMFVMVKRDLQRVTYSLGLSIGL
jgi:hypothetical protein